MAYRGRGSTPSIGSDNGNSSSNGNDNSVSHNHDYIYYTTHHHFYYYFDKTFIKMEIMATLAVIIIGLGAYILTYKPSLIDPIETIKKTYINSQFIVMLILLILMGFSSFFSKSKKTLIKHLIIIVIVSFIAILVFLGIKINFNNKYNEAKFAEFYEILDLKEKENLKKEQNISIGLNGIKIADQKQIFIDENMQAYKFFSFKVISCIFLYIVLIIFIILTIIRLIRRQEKIDALGKDDAIVYDEEENIKI